MHLVNCDHSDALVHHMATQDGAAGMAQLRESVAALEAQLAGVRQELTERTLQYQRAEAAAASFEQRLATIADNMPAAVLYFDRSERFCFVNQTYLRWHKLPAGALLGRTMAEVFSDHDSTGARYRDVQGYVRRALTGEQVVFETQRLMQGDLRDVELTYVPHIETGEVQGFFGVMLDITDRKRSRLYDQEHATHDPLTGLLNRRALAERLNMALVRSDHHAAPLALLLFNLNTFRRINDLHGVQGGDRVLLRFAELLRDTSRKCHTIARLGDDHFVILAEDLSRGESDAILLAEKVMARLRDDRASGMTVTTSIGIAVRTAGGCGAGELLALADGAMYQSKQFCESSWTLA